MMLIINTFAPLPFLKKKIAETRDLNFFGTGVQGI